MREWLKSVPQSRVTPGKETLLLPARKRLV
jgi:hypothetical protein